MRETAHVHVTRSRRPGDARGDARNGQAAFALVSHPEWPDDSGRDSGAGLSRDFVRRRGRLPRMGPDRQRHIAGDQSHRRAPRAAFLASARLGGPVHPRRVAFPAQSRRRPAHAHASADRVLHGRGHFEGDFCTDDTAVSELGLGPGQRRRRHPAGVLSMGQHSGQRGLAARRIARHRTHLRGRCPLPSRLAGAQELNVTRAERHKS